MKPKITWINHASYTIENDEVCLLVDPWIDGTAFNDGWLHISKSYFSDDLLERVTHIWFSHEHPDHFSPKNLKEISLKCHNLPKVVFQKTTDKRVLNFIKKLGFECIEIEPFKEQVIKENFSMTIMTFPPIDSSLIVDINGYKIINVNDCIFEDEHLKKLGSYINNSCDLLLTQFNYASWIGTPDDSNLRKLAIKEKIFEIESQIEFFKPSYTIPFASFIWFCHEENFYMNDEMVGLEIIEQTISNSGSKAVIMYPGDSWELFEKRHFKNQENINKYNSDITQNVRIENTITTQLIQIDEIEKNANIYFQRIKEKNGKYLLMLICLISKIFDSFPLKYKLGFGGTSFRIKDHNATYKFDWIKGLQKSQIDNPHIVLSADSLNFILKFEFGLGSLNVNGRAIYKDLLSLYHFRRVFSLGLANSVGETFLSHALKKITKRVGDAIHDVEPSYLKN